MSQLLYLSQNTVGTIKQLGYTRFVIEIAGHT
ncbi:Uncharacterised protein [Vibrio cholerae]|nr:Uncharacterised protein [Vibrio cholerae]